MASAESFLARVLAFGIGFTTIFIVSGSVTDPVNVTKLVGLGVTSTIALGAVFANGIFKIASEHKALFIVSAFFVVASFSSVLLSDSPFSQGIFGSYGRNNGFLTYFYLVLLTVSVATIKSSESIRLIIKSLFVAGLINVVYCIWVTSFGDFIGWNNPYGNVLGTFGNPNFVGSFLGIFFSAYLAYGISKFASKKFKYSLLIVLPATFYAIYQSHAIQGRVVAISGTALVILFLIRSRARAWLVTVYIGFATLVGVFAILGALQIGPLENLIYKTSVSLRGQYWLAGWNTGNSHPFSGVGMDSFGDWYRRSRDSHALDMPGVNTVVNAAHNVPLDMFAFGGWPLFLSYVVIMLIGMFSLIRVSLRSTKYEPITVILVTVWVGYQIQSIISINQIGLAIWGWVINGAAIAYERITRITNEQIKPANTKNRSQTHSQSNRPMKLGAIIYPTIFGFLGLMTSLPPLTADAKWRHAQTTQTVQALKESMISSYFNPANSMKFSINIQTLEQSGFSSLARDYAVEAVKWNPDAFELWRALYFVKESTSAEKNLALENMRRLDPLNPDVTNIK